MSTALDTLITTSGPPRDGWGRYRLPHPDHPTETVAYTRATTVAKAPEDQGGLIKWGQRTVALGMGRRPDLVALAATTDPDDKKALARIAADAEEAGGATAQRNTGTAVHAAIEAVNRGAEPLPLFAAEVDAYRAALAAAHLEPVPELVERIVVHYDHRIAGTFDVALRHLDTGELFCADLKTGSVGYPASFAIQQTLYATADALVTPDYLGYEPLPEWSTERAIIIHLPQGGPCTLHEIDLVAGARGLAVALEVRKWRSEATAKRLLSEIASGPHPPTDATPVTAEVVSAGEGSVESHPEGGGRVADPDRVTWFRDRYEALRGTVAPEVIARAWAPGLPAPKRAEMMTPAQMDAALAILQRIEDDHGLPFATPDPSTPAPEPRHKPTPERTTTTTATPRDEGALVVPGDVVALRKRHTALAREDKARIDTWVRQGTDAGAPWAMGVDEDHVSQRRWNIARAAIGLARRTDDDEIARGWIELLIGDAVQTHPVGALLGALSIEEADELGSLTVAHSTFAAALAAVS